MARDPCHKKKRNNAGKNCYRLSATVVPQSREARGGGGEGSNAMSWLEGQHMCRFSNIYFIQLATLLGSSLTALFHSPCHSSCHSLYPLSLSSHCLYPFSALLSHIFCRPFDAFYFKAQRHRRIPLESGAAPRRGQGHRPNPLTSYFYGLSLSAWS